MEALRRLEQTLLGFVAQGSDYVLLLACRDLDVPICLKVLQAVDDNSPQDVYLRFGHACGRDPFAYVQTVVNNVTIQIEAANILRTQRGLEPWALPPAACREGEVADRLVALLDHVGGIWPAEDDHRVLWAFLPVSIEDPVAYAKVAAPFLPVGAAKAGHRVVLRAQDQIVEVVRRRDDMSACLMSVDFSPEAAAADLAASAASPDTPPRQRVVNLFVLAGMDFAARRYAPAAYKYAAVYEYFDGVADSEGIRAACLLGVGDVARVTGDEALAIDRYRQALALAAPSPGTVGLAMIACGHLGELCHVGGELADAAAYYRLASEIAGKLCNLTYKADAMEKLGAVLRDLGDDAAAVRTWTLARDLCAEGGYDAGLRSVTGRLLAGASA